MRVSPFGGLLWGQPYQHGVLGCRTQGEPVLSPPPPQEGNRACSMATFFFEESAGQAACLPRRAPTLRLAYRSIGSIPPNRRGRMRNKTGSGILR